MINSSINDYKQSKTSLFECQVLLEVKEYDSLKCDSYVDCSGAITDFSKENIADQALRDMSRIKNRLSEHSKQDVISAVAGSKTLIRRHKQWILEALC